MQSLIPRSIIVTLCLAGSAINTFGGAGYALQFTNGPAGSDQWVSIPFVAELNLFPMTVTAWIKAGAQPGDGFQATPFITKLNAGGPDGWGISLFNGDIRAQYFSGSSSISDGPPVYGGLNGGPVGTNEWHHIAFTVDGDGGKIYVDGVIRTNRFWMGPPQPTTQASPVFLGSLYAGLLDEVTIWNEALTLAQIKANMSRGLTGFEPGLVVYFRCDEVMGPLSIDSAPLAGLNNGFWQMVTSVPSDAPISSLPTVQTLAATGLGGSVATLNGMVNPEGLFTSAWFEWGTTTNYGNVTDPVFVGNWTNTVPFGQAISNLAVGTLYHFRVVATNEVGKAVGADLAFLPVVFADSGIMFTNLGLSAAAWGDFDNDNWLDLLTIGSPLGTNTTFGRTQLWRNTGSGFTNFSPNSFNAYNQGAVAWGDFNNDGRLDFVVTGYRPLLDDGDLELWRNTGAEFTVVSDTMGFATTRMHGRSAAWADYDADGGLDLLVNGSHPPSSFPTELWKNSGDKFTDVTGLTEIYTAAGAVNWADVDNDGRPDALLRFLYRNTGNSFMPVTQGFDLSIDSIAWGDYDNDGRLDALVAGRELGSTARITLLLRNTGSGFEDVTPTVAPGLPLVVESSVAWGDYDNDGRVDMLLTGSNTLAGAVAQVWKNTPSGFTNINAKLPGVRRGTAIWGDYDRDGRLDILLTGLDSANLSLTRLYRNLTAKTNTPPAPPTVLTASGTYEGIKLSWNSGSDAQTPASGLSYNVRAGTTPGGTDLLTSHVDAATGMRRLPELGNAFSSHQLMINGLTNGQTVYWSVQAIDSAFTGSAFAPESAFRVYQAPPQVTSPGVITPPTGDTSGDGIVDQAELNSVLSSYFSTSPWLQMTNVAGLGGTDVTFALTNDLSGNLSVEYTTDFTDWHLLGPATPRYLFTDTNAPALPQRYYRLRWP
jgi:hypothetical protein